jgi:regulator of protease activity HflC (stomatin/prohibitin superfamily)
MRLINVLAYEKALVFKNGKLVDVLSEGRHWLGWNKTVTRCDVTELFYHEMDLDLLLKNPAFKEQTDVKRVADSEILIQYKDGNVNQVLEPGRYCYWNEGINYSYDLIDLNSGQASADINRKVLNLAIIRRYVSRHVIESYERALLYIDGVLVQQLGSGTYYYWVGDKNIVIKKADMRTQQVEVSGQELLTKDKAAIRVNAYASYEIDDVVVAMDETKDFARQLYILIQLGIREYVGQYSLDDFLANKTVAGPYIQQYAQDQAKSLGIKLVSCGIRDIILPGDVKEIMNRVLIAEKAAQANVIMRREETASARSLLNTAKLMESNDMLYRLKEMEYMERISDKIGEITVNGSSQVIDQLRGLITTPK